MPSFHSSLISPSGSSSSIICSSLALCTNLKSSSTTSESKDDEATAEFKRAMNMNALLVCPSLLSSESSFVNSLKGTRHDMLTRFNKGTTTLGFIVDSGLVIACDSRASQGQLISSQVVRKILEINSYLLGTMAGGAADCSFWERYLAKECRLFELRNETRVSVAAASKMLANIFYNYSGYGLSCGTMLAGYDQSKKCCELYMVDDEGQRVKNDIFSVGSGSVYAYSVLDALYDKKMPKEEAIELAKKAIYHATHRDAASGGVCRVYWIDEHDWQISEDGVDVTILHHKYCQEKNLDVALM